MLPDPSPVVRSFPGYVLQCLVSGSRPIYTAVIHNSTVLFNTTKPRAFPLDKEGNYSCVATSKYGTDMRNFSVVFIGKNSFST